MGAKLLNKDTKLHVGDEITVEIARAAHGGEGIGVIDGIVVFVPGTFIGDVLRCEVTQVKKNFARATAKEITTPSPLRVDSRCPAANLGAGCCDFATIDPEAEDEYKAAIVRDQLSRLARGVDIPPIRIKDLGLSTQWRSRMRLGVDSNGNAGSRKLRSNAVVAEHPCSQAVPGLLDGIVGPGAQKFSPGAEVIVVLDDAANRHVVEVRRAARGRRSEKVTKIIEGSGEALQTIGATEFRLPATAFWQAHIGALPAYSEIISTALAETCSSPGVAWDLYGGVGAFVPAIQAAFGPRTEIHSVEVSPHAARVGQKTFDSTVHFHTAAVEKIVEKLPPPTAVVLDPPRSGATATAISAIAQAQPQCVVHIGCDPATFARDVKIWDDKGYQVTAITMLNAFPATHHCESIAVLVPTNN